MIRNSHLACTHAATKVARAQCRKQRAAAIDAGLSADLAVTSRSTDDAVAAQIDRELRMADRQREIAADLEQRVMKLTVNQRNQAAARLSGEVTDKAMLHRCTLALADIARTKKTTIAKLSLRDIKSVL
ncbi:hypothetical protein SEA_MARGARET_38 [Gordonia phage Margaret]|nr:hypothetical protein SEA_MARGARET_38 [Gordonia phage Margaret]